MIPSKQKQVRDLIVAGRWVDLCEVLRDWYAKNFPLYSRDIRESAIGTWISRILIRSAQVHSLHVPDAKWFVELDGEITTFVASSQLQYDRFCHRIDNHPSAEKMISSTRSWLQTV